MGGGWRWCNLIGLVCRTLVGLVDRTLYVCVSLAGGSGAIGLLLSQFSQCPVQALFDTRCTIAVNNTLTDRAIGDGGHFAEEFGATFKRLTVADTVAHPAHT